MNDPIVENVKDQEYYQLDIIVDFPFRVTKSRLSLRKDKIRPNTRPDIP